MAGHIGETVECPPCPCPYCGKRLDGASPVGGSEPRPEPGDPSVCIGCASPLAFNPDMTLRRPARADVRRWKRDGSWEHISALAGAVRQLDRRSDGA